MIQTIIHNYIPCTKSIKSSSFFNLQSLVLTFGWDDTEHHEVMDKYLPHVPQLLLLDPSWDSTRITRCASSKLGPLVPQRIKGTNTWMNWSRCDNFTCIRWISISPNPKKRWKPEIYGWWFDGLDRIRVVLHPTRHPIHHPLSHQLVYLLFVINLLFIFVR